MKLLIITDAWHPQVNGVVRTYEHLIEGLEKLDHEIRVISAADFKHKIPMPGYSEIDIVISPYRQLERMIEAHDPDWIHCSTEGPLGWAGRRYCLKHKRDYTTTYHTHFPDYIAKRVAKFLPFLYRPVHAWARGYVRKFHAHSKAMMVATQSLEDELKSWGFKTPMQRLTRGAKLDMFYPGEKTKFMDMKGPVALYVGRVAIEKNIEAFLEMDWHGSKVIIGDGPSRSELESKFPDAHFIGTKQGEDLAEHYRSADLFVFPSKTDTFGIVLVEALASGLPVAGFNVTGPMDIITEPFLGALHETDIGIAAAEAIKNGTTEQRANHVKTHFTWENATRQFEQAHMGKGPFQLERERKQAC